MSKFYYLNGNFLSPDETKIHVSDLAFTRGYGIFDFFRVINGKPIFLDDHLDRFEFGARYMRLRIPAKRKQLKEIISDLIILNFNKQLGIKLILTGGYSNDDYTPAKVSNLLITARSFVYKNFSSGINLMPLQHQRVLPEVKTLNYIIPIKFLPQLHSQKAYDYLYYSNGVISETSRCNIFIVKNDKIITPAKNILHGITRKHVINICKQRFEFEEKEVTLQEVLNSDEVFVTASSKRIIPVSKIGNRCFDGGKMGHYTKTLQSIFLKEENIG